MYEFQSWRKLLPWYFPPHYNKDFFDPAALVAAEASYALKSSEKYTHWKEMETLLYPQHVGQPSSDLRPILQDDLQRIPPWYGMTGGVISGPSLTRAEAQYASQYPSEYSYWKRVEILKRQGRTVSSAKDLTKISNNFEFVRKNDIHLAARVQWLGLLVSPIGFISYLWADDNDWWAHTLVFIFLFIGLVIASVGWLSDDEQAKTLVSQENEDRLLAVINASTHVASLLNAIRNPNTAAQGDHERLGELRAESKRAKRMDQPAIELDIAKKRKAKANKESIEQQQAATALGVEVKRCQYCVLFIPESSTSCQHCGNNV